MDTAVIVARAEALSKQLMQTLVDEDREAARSAVSAMAELLVEMKALQGVEKTAGVITDMSAAFTWMRAASYLNTICQESAP